MLKHALTLSLVLATSAFAQSKLKVTPITASGPGFLVNATLITGEKEAILVDTTFTRADAHRVVAAILDSGKTLTTVYVTHAHPDHYFGGEVIKAAFPNAKFIASADTVAGITKTWEGKVKQWGPMYGANLTDKVVVPEVTKEKALTLDGEKIELVGPVQGDDAKNTYVWIPSSKTLIAGDILYAGTHVWTAETKVADRKGWIKTLDTLKKLGPTTVIPGHQVPDAKQDASIIDSTKQYLADFDLAVSGSKTTDEVQTKMKSKYANLALDPVLKFGADAQFTTAAAPAPAKK
jgi:glyoxylase-like metal-dependent hydrolase (beta-lactamase superfamily II)